MTLSLELTLFGLLTVFGVLLLYYAVIAVLGRVFPYKPETEPAAEAPAALCPSEPELNGVDNETAAVIIAIVSEETGIPADRLPIKSIRKQDSK